MGLFDKLFAKRDTVQVSFIDISDGKDVTLKEE